MLYDREQQMEMSLAAQELLWEQAQHADRAQARRERRAWLKSFLWVLALIASTLIVATLLADWAPQELRIV